VLALIRAPTGLHYATADPWELRSVGTLACNDRLLRHAIARLVRKEKPSSIVAGSPSLRFPAKYAAKTFGIRVLDAPSEIPPIPVASDLYPELGLRATSAALVKVARLAIASVLYNPVSSRRYAPRRHRPPEHAA
jgi:hypothetical protein